MRLMPSESPRTERTSFSIDATGFSPEIASDLDDVQYLDPHGVNRRFVIITPEQAEQPVVNINFSFNDRLHAQVL